jgi:hypothetical protein
MDDASSIASAALTSATCYPRHSSTWTTKSPVSQHTTDPVPWLGATVVNSEEAFADSPAAGVIASSAVKARPCACRSGAHRRGSYDHRSRVSYHRCPQLIRTEP